MSTHDGIVARYGDRIAKLVIRRAVACRELRLPAPCCSVALVDVSRSRIVAAITSAMSTHDGIVARYGDRIAKLVIRRAVTCRELDLISAGASG